MMWNHRIGQMLQQGWRLRPTFLADSLDGDWKAYIEHNGTTVGVVNQSAKGGFNCVFEGDEIEAIFKKDAQTFLADEIEDIGDAVVCLAHGYLQYERWSDDCKDKVYYRLSQDIQSYGEIDAPNRRLLEQYGDGPVQILRDKYGQGLSEIINESVAAIDRDMQDYEGRFALVGGDVSAIPRPTGGGGIKLF